ncbi:MAG: MarR family winged helix-turn-helix transcriptional regulator [Clostridium sp.]|nr:MAG: MarR family winged helix-turn-helix transcriptional regulator [Clostridium sp.]
MLSPSQIMITRFLYKNSDKVVYQKDLEKGLPFRKSTISGIIQTMIKNNIIDTKSSKNDLRSKEVTLTPYGKKNK